MRFITQLELNITITDTNAMYATNYEQMLLDHARQLYSGKCRDGQYIESIDGIAKRSLPNLIRRDLQAKVRVYVAVEATVIRYDPYDFVTGVKIKKIIPSGKISNFDMLECRNDHVVALMRVNEGVGKFKIGDVIPIRVGQVMYKIDNTHILINGFPCLPHVPEPIAYQINEIDNETKAYYAKMVEPLLAHELARKEKLNQTMWKEMAHRMHPYKKVNPVRKGSRDMTKPHALANGTYFCDYQSDLGELKVTSAPEGIPILQETAKVALTRLAVHFIKWIEMINDLVEEYPDEKAIATHSHIWDAFSNAKI